MKSHWNYSAAVLGAGFFVAVIPGADALCCFTEYEELLRTGAASGWQIRLAKMTLIGDFAASSLDGGTGLLADEEDPSLNLSWKPS